MTVRLRSRLSLDHVKRALEIEGGLTVGTGACRRRAFRLVSSLASAMVPADIKSMGRE